MLIICLPVESSTIMLASRSILILRARRLELVSPPLINADAVTSGCRSGLLVIVNTFDDCL